MANVESYSGAHPKDHDPGPSFASARAESALSDSHTTIITQRGTRVLFGTASWTDPTITKSGVFYPNDAKSAEERLRFYASRFPVVEVDSTYYALPAPNIAQLWSERTPQNFVFHIKAHALMTGQPSEVKRLPAALREALPAALQDKARIYAKDLPAELHTALWRMFLDALVPLLNAGKLGAVFLQYPRWFLPNRESARVITEAREQLGDVPAAVEFRHGSWLGPRSRDRTMDLLTRLGMSYVIADTPEGTPSSLPLDPAVTSTKLAIVRLHGKRSETWERPVRVVSERYRYLYDASELRAWVPRVQRLAEEAEHVHVIFNNCYANYGTTNAVELAAMVSRVYRAAD